MTTEEVRKILITTLGDVVGIRDNGSVAPRLARGENVGIDELEIESLGLLDWAFAIEQETGIDIDSIELRSFHTLDELAAHLAQRMP